MKQISVAIVGATGLVGSVLLSLLKEREFPLKNLYLLASEQSAGKQIIHDDVTHVVEDLAGFDFSKTQFAFFCVSSDLAKTYIPKAVAAGNTVIDKSTCFRNDDAVPLIVPEVNMDAISNYKNQAIIASPNCNTIPVAVALKPIYDAVGIKRINIATYQSVSGTGKEAVLELKQQSRQILDEQKPTVSVYPQQIAFNILPHIDDFLDNGYTREEMKVVWEMQKIFNDKQLQINPTAVRVPVFCGHAAAVHIETARPFELDDIYELMREKPGITLMDGYSNYATPATNAAGSDNVYVSRIRRDISHDTGISMWIVADNLRKGAALNAVQIAEHLIKEED